MTNRSVIKRVSAAWRKSYRDALEADDSAWLGPCHMEIERLLGKAMTRKESMAWLCEAVGARNECAVIISRLAEWKTQRRKEIEKRTKTYS